MKNLSPSVTFGVPVYNGEKFVAEALESLLAQSYSDFEIVISDNASTDGTESICRGFVNRDERVRYVRQSVNRGSVSNFNCLVGMARGKFFKWAAADDLCRPNYLEAVVPLLESSPGVVWCHSQSGKVDQAGRVLGDDDAAAEYLSHSLSAGFPRPHHDSKQRYLRYKGVVLGSSWCADTYGLIRMSTLTKTKLMPACYGSEKVLMGELALWGVYLEAPETLFFQRVHASASGSMANKAQQEEYALARPKRKFSLTRFGLFWGHICAIRNVPMSFSDRTKCYGVIGQYLLQWRKWHKIILDDIQGRPLGQYMVEGRVALKR